METHITRPGTYVGIYVLLLGLTALTVGLSFIDMGAFNLIVGLIIAAVKAWFIAQYFMHLRHSTGIQRMALMAGIFWLAILIIGTMDDYLTRGWLPVPGK